MTKRQKTYDRQSGKLVARIAENLPELSGKEMQWWIDNPEEMKKVLSKTLKKRRLRYLYSSGYAFISPQMFIKDMFLQKQGFRFGREFNEWILPEIPNGISGNSSFEGELMIFGLSRPMTDLQIMKDMGNPKPFTIDEFISIVNSLVIEDENEDDLSKKNNLSFNKLLFYVRLKNRQVLAVLLARWKNLLLFEAYRFEGPLRNKDIHVVSR